MNRTFDRFRWAAGLLGLLPVLGVFTLHRLFFVRDLTLFFWSRHLWLRHTVAGGSLPLWNPYLGGGLPAVTDALNQLWMPLTLAIRLLPSAVVSFNLWVALPVPLASFGAYGFLARRVRPGAALLGALAFAWSGPMLSTLNAPNLSWSVACLPWVAWAADRVIELPSAGRAARLAITFALQALCGEPVTLVATAFVALVQGVFGARVRGRGRAIGWLVCGLALGGLLAAVQLWPTALAGIRAERAAWSETPDFWSLHPLGLIELVMPHLFGNYYDAFLADMPWMAPLNSGREPFFYSIYVGPLVVMLAAAGIATRRREARPWIVATAVLLFAAFGGYTPVYPLLRSLLPFLAFFRFPVKYLAIAAFPLAVLTAFALDAVARGEARHRAIRAATAFGSLAALAAVAVTIAAVAPPLALRAAGRLAAQLTLEEPARAAAVLVRTGGPLAAREAGLLLVGSALLAMAARNGARASLAWMALAVATAGDLALNNGPLNPTMPLARMTPPAWYTAMANRERLYVGGRLRGFMDPSDEDGSKHWEVPKDSTAVEGRFALNAELPLDPSGWQVREALSYDLPVLAPAEYATAVRRFLRSLPIERQTFLRRSGVRWCVVPEDSEAPGTDFAQVEDWGMLVRECFPAAQRAFVATRVEVEPDVLRAMDALFDRSVPDGTARVPQASGAPPVGRGGTVRLTADGANQVELTADVPRDALVVLRDSYDPSWRVTVDARPGDLVRVNGLHRGVRVTAGHHVIRFEYRPRPVEAGLMITVMSALMLGGLVWRDRAPRRDRGFTLVELLIVMAIIGILLGIAFARYEGMQARANEASARASLQTIQAAEWTFAHTCGNMKYAMTLPALAQPIPSSGEGFLSPDLTAGEIVEHSGYAFQITAKPSEGALQACSGVPLADGYALTADPVRPGSSGTSYFGTNTDRVIYSDSATFLENMPETGAPSHGTEVKTP